MPLPVRLDQYELWDSWNHYRDAALRQMIVKFLTQHDIPYTE